eukprot:4569587-Alexandrium_andersonii.AAC.1
MESTDPGVLRTPVCPEGDAPTQARPIPDFDVECANTRRARGCPGLASPRANSRGRVVHQGRTTNGPATATGAPAAQGRMPSEDAFDS